MQVRQRQQHVFVSTVMQFDFAGPEIKAMNSDLKADLDELRMIDAGCVRSNDPRVESWYSSIPLIGRGGPYRQFMRCAGLACERMWSEFGIAGDPEVNALWSIVTPPGGSNVPHFHPRSVASGVYYLESRSRCGELRLMDPRAQTQMFPVKYWAGNPDSRRYAHSDLSVEPLPGRMVMFPSWIQHYVEPNLSGCDRVVLAFNVVQRLGKVEFGP